MDKTERSRETTTGKRYGMIHKPEEKKTLSSSWARPKKEGAQYKCGKRPTLENVQQVGSKVRRREGTEETKWVQVLTENRSWPSSRIKVCTFVTAGEIKREDGGGDVNSQLAGEGRETRIRGYRRKRNRSKKQGKPMGKSQDDPRPKILNIPLWGRTGGRLRRRK